MIIYMKKLIVLAIAAMICGIANVVYAWGGKGHQMQARVALANLPSDMPAFFGKADEEMAMLISEPDHWRTAEEPDLDEVTGVNHTFRWEIAPKPLPANRHLFIIELAKQGKIEARNNGVREYGTAPYGIQEWAEMLTGAFRRWRAMKETTPAGITRKRMQEKSILFIAGVLGHWITDMSNPIHASIHVHGWHPSVPNPNGYAGPNDDPHGRYEGKYVDRVIEQGDVAALVNGRPRIIGDWLNEAETYIAATNSHVEQIYAWDKLGRFGDGHEPKEAKPFTAERLADGARELRDYWYTAWVKSGEPMPAKKRKTEN